MVYLLGLHHILGSRRKVGMVVGRHIGGKVEVDLEAGRV